MNSSCPGPSRVRRTSHFDGLLGEVYGLCTDMPDALQGLLDQLAAREQSADAASALRTAASGETRSA